MRNRVFAWAIRSVALVLVLGILAGPSVAQQTDWPPIQIDVQPAAAGDLVTFEIKITNVVDWTLVDFTLKSSIPPHTSFVEAHAEFDGAVVDFDGQDASFFVIGLPQKATIGVHYVVKKEDPQTLVNAPQVWAGWKGRMPGQALFDYSKQTVGALAVSALLAGSNTVQVARDQGLSIVEVNGGPYDQGVQRGQVLSAQIKSQVSDHLASVLPGSFGGNRGKWVEALQPLLDSADRDVLDEIRGLADGSGVALEDLQLANFAAYIAASDSTTAGSIACSVLATVGAANQKSSLLLGRQQDVMADNVPPVLIVRSFADGRPGRLEVSQPGSVEPAAVVTAKGLFWEGHAAFTKEPIAANAADSPSLIVSTLRSARSLDDLQAGLTARPRLKAMNSVIADLATGEIVSLELSSTRTAAGKPDRKGVLISTNHFSAATMKDLQPPSVNRSMTRYDRLNNLALARLGQTTVDDMQAFLHDPQVSGDTGMSLVVDADTRRLRLWDQSRRRWFEIALADVFGSS